MHYFTSFLFVGRKAQKLVINLLFFCIIYSNFMPLTITAKWKKLFFKLEALNMQQATSNNLRIWLFNNFNHTYDACSMMSLTKIFLWFSQLTSFTTSCGSHSWPGLQPVVVLFRHFVCTLSHSLLSLWNTNFLVHCLTFIK